MDKLKLIGVCATVFAMLNNANIASASLPTNSDPTREGEREIAENTSSYDSAYLDLSNTADRDLNAKDSIPEIIYSRELFNSLKTVRLEFCKSKLRRFPIELGELPNLEKLYMYGNELCDLPTVGEMGGQFLHLKILDLGNNKLTKFPVVLGHLPELLDLELNDNKLWEVSPVEKERIEQQLEELSENGDKKVQKLKDDLTETGFNQEDIEMMADAHIGNLYTEIMSPVKEAQLLVEQVDFDGLFPQLERIYMKKTSLLTFPWYLLHFQNLNIIDLRDNHIMDVKKNDARFVRFRVDPTKEEEEEEHAFLYLSKQYAAYESFKWDVFGKAFDRNFGMGCSIL